MFSTEPWAWVERQPLEDKEKASGGKSPPHLSFFLALFKFSILCSLGECCAKRHTLPFVRSFGKSLDLSTPQGSLSAHMVVGRIWIFTL